MGPMGFQVLMGLLDLQGLELQWDHTTLHLTIQDHLAQLLMVLQPHMLPRDGEMRIHIGSNRLLLTQLRQEQIQTRQLGLLIMLTITNSRHSPHLQLLLVHQLQPKLTDKVTTEISRIQLQLDRLIIQRLGKNTTRKWVKQFLLLLGPHQEVSQIIVQPGQNTTDSKLHIMPRQVPKECRSTLQHLRFKLRLNHNHLALSYDKRANKKLKEQPDHK